MTTANRTLRRSPRRRDRRGRGLRGLLYPSTIPAAKTRAERFDAMVLEALDPIEQRWGAELTELDLAVDDVPEVDETSPDEVVWQAGVLADVGVPLAQLVPAGVDPEGLPSRARIVLYRRPLEARARGGADLADLLHEVLVEQVAEYLNIEPDVVDGGGRGLSRPHGARHTGTRARTQVVTLVPARVLRASSTSDGRAAQAPALALGEPAPDAEALVVREGVLQALGPDLAPRADALGLPRRAALLREERLGVGLGAQRALLPVRLLGLPGVSPNGSTIRSGSRSRSTPDASTP